MIFITRDNILGYGLPIYHIDRQIKEINKAFQDEVHIIYVNSRKQDDTELGRLMHDLHCKRADKMESGEKRGELKTQKETVLFMAEEGMDVKQIVRLVKVTEKEVQKWIDESLCVMK